jgi:hypothetical protein
MSGARSIADTLIEARRVSGAGNVTVFPPSRARLSSVLFHPDANVNGNPDF